MSLRRVRSPEAPKMTMVHGSGVRARRMPRRRGFSAVTAAAMRLLLHSLHGVAAEFVAQGGDDLGAEVLFLARDEALQQRDRDDGRRHVMVDGVLHRPASLARILHVALDLGQLRVTLKG